MATKLFNQLNQNWTPPSYQLWDVHDNEKTPLMRSLWPSLSTTCISIAILFVLLNLKNFPGIWHLRLLNAFRFILRTHRPRVKPSPSHIFQPLITSSSAPILELDYNIHKSNSSYFSDVDISRTHLVCTLFAKGIERMRGGTEAYTRSKDPLFGLALGAVSCSFRKEVMPYQQYDMWSRVLAWDEKWIYVVTHFVRKGIAATKSFTLYPQQGTEETLSSSGVKTEESSSEFEDNSQPVIFATALSKCVFKSGRKTVSPDSMLQLSDLLPTDTEQNIIEGIEEQRVQGLKLCTALAAQNQKSLEAEFSGSDGKVLARHADGSGIIGVVSTLLQLAGLKRSQSI